MKSYFLMLAIIIIGAGGMARAQHRAPALHPVYSYEGSAWQARQAERRARSIAVVQTYGRNFVRLTLPWIINGCNDIGGDKGITNKGIGIGGDIEHIFGRKKMIGIVLPFYATASGSNENGNFWV